MYLLFFYSPTPDAAISYFSVPGGPARRQLPPVPHERPPGEIWLQIVISEASGCAANSNLVTIRNILPDTALRCTGRSRRLQHVYATCQQQTGTIGNKAGYG
jgi:hypothetical protein